MVSDQHRVVIFNQITVLGEEYHYHSVVYISSRLIRSSLVEFDFPQTARLSAKLWQVCCARKRLLSAVLICSSEDYVCD
jgi:hypothetical protein